MSLDDSKKKYGLVTDFSWKIVGAFSLILLATYVWSYLTNDLNRSVSILKENKYIVSSAFKEFTRIDRESISWMRSFSIDDQVKYEEDISNLNDKIIKIKSKDLGGLDILIALNKHKEYWDILTNNVLQINLLSAESNSSFYKFNDFVLSNTKSSEIINKIILLPELHRQITDMKSSIVMSAIERDIALIVKSIPLSEDYAKKYLIIINDIKVINEGFSSAIKIAQSERYESRYDVADILNLLTLKLSAEENKTLEKIDVYFYILMLITIIVILYISMIILNFKRLEDSNKIEISRVFKGLNDKLLISDSKQKSKTNFLSVVSYEARTTLDAVLGFTRLAQHSSTNPSQLSKLNEVVNSSQKLNSLLDEVLDFIDIELGSVALQTEAFSPKCVFDVLVERYDTLAKNKNILFETDIDLSIGSVYLGDQLKFFKVFDFLLSNSISYTDKGHIILTVSVDNEASSISNYQRLNVSIEDTGINLTKEEAGDLFDPYSAAMFNSSRKSGGSGIRLSTAARLIDMMDGEIEIEYKNGSGLTFNFYLYLENADHGQIPISVDSLSDKKDDNKHLNLQKLNVLVVEDNKTNSTLLTWVLEDLGHEVMVAENGIECLNSLENNEFDIIFMDQHMPGMDGEEATRKIRARSDHKANIAIVGCTADAFQETRDSLIEAGQNDIILKPISDDLIFDVTQKFLNGDYDIKTETENVHDDK